jgi:hypothetical protein
MLTLPFKIDAIKRPNLYLLFKYPRDVENPKTVPNFASQACFNSYDCGVLSATPDRHDSQKDFCRKS